MTPAEETAERNACDEWWHAQPNKGASIQEAWVERARRSVPDGYMLVPIEPTVEMIVAIENQIDSQLTASGMDPRHMFRQDGEYVYEAMIAAAPASSVASKEGDAACAPDAEV